MSVVAPPPSLPLSYEDGKARPPQGKPALTIGIVLLDQFTLAAFAGFVDVLRLAGDHGGRSRQIHTAWRVMSWDGKPRCSSAGLTIEVEAGLPDDPAQFDYIAVCGGNDYSSGRMPEPLRDWLRLAAALRVRLLGICTGTFALAQADVIGPRTVCVHWNVLEAFRERFAQTRAVVDRLFVDEGDLISCAGSTAAIDLGLYLVARHCGRDKAQQAMRHMMLQGGAAGPRAAGAFPHRPVRHPGPARAAGGAFHRAAHRQSSAAGRHRALRRRGPAPAGTGLPPGHRHVADGVPAAIAAGIWQLVVA